MRYFVFGREWEGSLDDLIAHFQKLAAESDAWVRGTAVIDVWDGPSWDERSRLLGVVTRGGWELAGPTRNPGRGRCGGRNPYPAEIEEPAFTLRAAARSPSARDPARSPSARNPAAIRARSRDRGAFAWLGTELYLERAAGRAGAPPTASPAALVDFVRQAVPDLGRFAHERFIVIGLDGKMRPVGVTTVAVGGPTSTQVHLTAVFRSLLLLPAVACAFAHNHPSGDPEPSADDRHLTERLVQAGNLLGVRVIDHLVVTESGAYVSFSERGWLVPRFGG